MGKKQTCPYCKEKVDLKRMFSNPYPLVLVDSGCWEDSTDASSIQSVPCSGEVGDMRQSGN